MRRLGGLLLALFALYAGGGLLLWFAQDRLIFPAPDLDRGTLDAIAAQVGAEPVAIGADDGTRLYGWRRPVADRRGVVLFFHGNAEVVGERLELQELVTGVGFEFISFAYRGYPGSEGRPSEAGIARDARAAWRYVTEELGVPPGRVVLHGKSLGGGVAASLATEVDPGALVLESTFTSVRDIAARGFPIYPARWLLKHPFETRRRAPAIDAPVLVLHGAADQVIPVAHGRALAESFPDAPYVEAPGVGHGETLPAVHPPSHQAYVELLGRVGRPGPPE